MDFRYSIQIQVMQYTPLCHVTSTCLELRTNQNRTSRSQKPCVEHVNILFIFILKAIFNPIKMVLSKIRVKIAHLMQYWRMHWCTVSMVEFPVELSLIMLSKPKMSGNKTYRRTGKLVCNCAFPLWSILESYIYSYQTWFKSVKGFAETDTVKIKHKKISSPWPWP